MSEYDFNPLESLIEKRGQGCVHEPGKIWRIFLIAVSGIVLLAAERGTGKTTLVNRFLEAIQEGLDFLGAFKATKGKCLLIQGDEQKNMPRPSTGSKNSSRTGMSSTRRTSSRLNCS